ncbi:glycosyltransferase family 4 protein [Streptomyces sp. NPDC055103]
MRILFILPVYGEQVLPTGAFVTSREYVRGLAAAGHQVDVVTTIREPGRPRQEGGVRVWPLTHWRRALQAVRPELLVSHHGDRKAARITALASSIPHLLMVHGMAQDQDLRDPSLAWFPSHACRDHYPGYHGQVLVLPPPIDPAVYRTRPGSLITLNGSTPEKGADVLAAVAERLPTEQFLMVRAASHDPGPQLPNVTVVERTAPRDVYARTRILLMPSTTESYGRVGIEAMLSGIPVIAAPLPGIREALGVAAAYANRSDIPGWVRAVARLTAPTAYAAASQRARAHADALNYEANLGHFEQACLSLRRRRPPPTRPQRAPRRRPARAA